MIDIDFRYYLAVFRKGLPLFLLVWVLFSVLGVVVAYVLPPVYRSQATILVESQNITLVQETVQTPAAEQIQKIETLLMTRPNLLEISELFNVFSPDSDLSPTEMADVMRNRTEFRQVAFGNRSGRAGITTVAFTVSYKHRNPVVANRVAGELITRILERNIDDRKNKAIETYEYFKQERARLLNQLTDLETQIVNLKNENKASLPERLSYNQTELSRAQDRLIQYDREELALKEQQGRLQRVLDNPALAAQAGIARQTPQQRELEQLQLELAQRSTIYSESNPQIIQLKTRIEALEGIIAGASDTEEDNTDALFSPLRDEIRQIENKLELIAQQRSQTEAKMTEYRVSIDQTPNVENQLNILNREHATIELQYRENEALLSDAAAGQVLEINNQGQRFTVVEQPQIPDEPESPNRLLIAGGGVGFGVAAGFGLLILLELLNTSVRRPADLISGLGIQPFATIPFIETRREIFRRRLKLFFGFLIVASIIPIAVILVHYYVMPVDLLLDQILDRFGLPKFSTMIS